jgi:hypothetical protein
MGEIFTKIGNNLYTNYKHHYIIKVCEFCNKEFYCRKDKIIHKKTCNRNCYQNLIEKNNLYNIDKDVESIIMGSLLSDGSLTKGNKGKNYLYTHSSIHEEYIDYLINCMNINLIKYEYKSRKNIFKNGKEYFCKNGFYFRSKASTTFTKLRQKWYINGKKIVPKDIKLNKIILLHWFLGDGNLSYGGINLCTDSFDEESNQFLLEQLYEMDFLPYVSSKNRIIIPNKRVFEFLKYIGDCPVNCFNYKWNTIVKESYNNRICLNCSNVFDTNCNHKKFCCNKCSIRYSNKKGHL